MKRAVFFSSWISGRRGGVFGLVALFAAALAAQRATPLEFSWRRVSLFAELSKKTGDFTPQEVRFIASHYAIVVIEKAQSLRQRGDTESGSKMAVAQLKAANPALTVLVYWNAYVDYDRMYASLRDKPLPEDWFLGPGIGLPNADPYPWRHFDTSNADYQRWWVDRAVELVQDSGADGLFADGFPQVAAYPHLLNKQVGHERAVAMVAGGRKLLRDLKARLPDDAIVIFNGLRSMPDGWADGGASFLTDASGALLELFDFQKNTAKEQIVSDMDLIRAAEERGKIVLVKGWPATALVGTHHAVDPDMPAEADRDVTFPLACFLIVAGGHSYFGYSWGYDMDEGWLRTYDAFNRELGPPLGPAQRHGWLFEREFAHAAVSVDLDTKTASIDWR